MKAKPLALSRVEIAKELKSLKGWKHRSGILLKTYKFSDFKAAFSFMQAIAKVANSIDHHPEWKNVYNKVEVELTTHDLGRKVGPLDIKMAHAMEKQFAKH